jgi:hypothetical protein
VQSDNAAVEGPTNAGIADSNKQLGMFIVLLIVKDGADERVARDNNEAIDRSGFTDEKCEA